MVCYKVLKGLSSFYIQYCEKYRIHWCQIDKYPVIGLQFKDSKICINTVFIYIDIMLVCFTKVSA